MLKWKHTLVGVGFFKSVYINLRYWNLPSMDELESKVVDRALIRPRFGKAGLIASLEDWLRLYNHAVHYRELGFYHAGECGIGRGLCYFTLNEISPVISVLRNFSGSQGKELFVYIGNEPGYTAERLAFVETLLDTLRDPKEEVYAAGTPYFAADRIRPLSPETKARLELLAHLWGTRSCNYALDISSHV